MQNKIGKHSEVKLYCAPMEGLTGYIYRKAHHAFFNPIEKYFSPFITANQKGELKSGELRDLLPENNQGLFLVPQLLTNNAKDFIQTSKEIKQLGYDEINFNLGCPSGTVVSKHRGAGFLAQKEALDQFLEEVFSAGITKISVKTRIGIKAPEEFYDLIEVYNKYPIKELIIHPRIREDYYKNKPNLKIFSDALSLSKNPICYNGDIFKAQDYKTFTELFPTVGTIMLGRGLIANPSLAAEISGEYKVGKKVLKAFHDQIYEDYQGILFGERNVLFRMKELWFYMAPIFSDSEKYANKIKKAERLRDYEEAVDGLFREREIC